MIKEFIKNNVCVIAPDMHFYNVHLMKDCCLIPYTFYLEYGYKPVMVTTRCDDYPYLDKLPGLTIDFLEEPETYSGWIELCRKYIEDKYRDIDILFCFGPYEIYTELVPLYKELRSDGIVILKLDANIYWMDKIPHESESYKKLLGNSDLISCESKLVKRYLANKWPYKIEYVPNGFIEEYYEKAESYYVKENVILTVAEIGRQQKLHHVLMEAFGIASARISDWKLRMIGPIREDFKEYIDSYFIRYPDLKDRVIFTEAIVEKKELYQEYIKAKIFALTSLAEGFPNVLSEAAYYGCYVICSDIECAEDVVCGGRTGVTFPIGDIERLAEIFVEKCSIHNEIHLEEKYDEIRELWKNNLDYRKIVRKMAYLLGL